MSDVASYVKLEDLLFPGTVTLLSALQLTEIGFRVGAARRKYNVPYPGSSGDPAFERVFRAQQNTLEFHPIFMTCLWLSSIFFHPEISSGVGVIYIYSRHKYVTGYAKSVEGRIPGFRLGGRCLQAYLLMCIGGLLTVGLRRYTDIDLAQITSSCVQKMLPWK